MYLHVCYVNISILLTTQCRKTFNLFQLVVIKNEEVFILNYRIEPASKSRCNVRNEGIAVLIGLVYIKA